MRKDKIDPGKHYPPAYYRYREKHPTISIVLSNDIKDFLDRYKGDLTYKDVIIDILNNGLAMSKKLELSYNNKLNLDMDKFIEEKDREYEKKFHREILAREESIREELKSSISWNISQIRSKIVNRFALNQEEKSLIWRMFEDGGFSGTSMNFPDKVDNSTDEIKG